MTEKEPSEKMTTTQRIALGLSPVGTPPPTTGRAPTASETQKMMTQRMATATTSGMTTRIQTQGYRPGTATQRHESVRTDTRRRWGMWIAACAAVVSLVVIGIVIGGGERDVIERSGEEFKKNIVGEVSASSMPPLDSSGNPVARPPDAGPEAGKAAAPIVRDPAGVEYARHPDNWDEEGQMPIYTNKQLQYETENVQVHFAKPYEAPKAPEGPEPPSPGFNGGTGSWSEVIDGPNR
jgi:hypothetical protein